jgi:hypothetical protein
MYYRGFTKFGIKATVSGVKYSRNCSPHKIPRDLEVEGEEKKSTLTFLSLEAIKTVPVIFVVNTVLKYGSEEKGSSLCKCSILLGFIMSKNLRGL